VIPLGTLCYMVRNVDFEWLNGRAVEIVDYYDVDQDGVLWHVLAAPWITELFGDRIVTAREWNLRPICPPAREPREARCVMEGARRPVDGANATPVPSFT
jgi:hypothetical protein